MSEYAFAMADPVNDGLVASLGRPGGNVTGTIFLGPELVTKRLGLLSEVVPNTLAGQSSGTHVLMVIQDGWDGQGGRAGGTDARYAAPVCAGKQPRRITQRSSTLTTDRADALCVFPSPMLFGEYDRIVGIVAEKRLPTIYAAREGVELGGLMSYGANLAGSTNGSIR
jgi:putative ABC transport system substrate-binding protein